MYTFQLIAYFGSPFPHLYIYHILWFWSSVLQTWHLLHVCLSGERYPLSVALGVFHFSLWKRFSWIVLPCLNRGSKDRRRCTKVLWYVDCDSKDVYLIWVIYYCNICYIIYVYKRLIQAGHTKLPSMKTPAEFQVVATRSIDPAWLILLSSALETNFFSIQMQFIRTFLNNFQCLLNAVCWVSLYAFYAQYNSKQMCDIHTPYIMFMICIFWQYV